MAAKTATFDIYDLDLREHFKWAIKKTGTDLNPPTKALPFTAQITVTANNPEKITGDRLLLTKIRKKTDKHLMSLRAKLAVACQGYDDAVQNGRDQKKALKSFHDDCWKIVQAIERLVIKDGMAITTKYMKARSDGKVAAGKMKAGMAKNIMAIGGSSVGAATAVGLGVVTGGAAWAAVPGAVYGVAKSVIDLKSNIKREAATLEQACASLDKTLNVLMKNELAWEGEYGKKAKVTFRELTAKASKEIVGFNTQSIKKLKNDTDRFEQKCRQLTFMAAKQGKLSGDMDKHSKELDKMCAQATAAYSAQQSILARDPSNKALAKRVDVLKRKIDRTRKQAKLNKAAADRLLKEAAEMRKNARWVEKSTVPALRNLVQFYKKDRANIGWTSAVFKITPILVSLSGQDWGAIGTAAGASAAQIQSQADALAQAAGEVGAEVGSYVYDLSKKGIQHKLTK